jgi:orotidine-5'-phosphate decarboxylase
MKALNELSRLEGGLTVVSEYRDRLILALDSDDSVRALRWASDLRDYFAVAKVGPELLFASGPSIIFALRDLGYRIFLDFKLHDIPNTVYRAAKVLSSYGPDFMTVHTAGGLEMVKSAVRGAVEGSEGADEHAPIVLGVTVLTSAEQADEGEIAARVEIALEAGCQGYVCGVPDLAVAKKRAPGLVAVVPGIRPANSDSNDQRRIGTLAMAFDAGADYLVIGRAVTSAKDPVGAAASLMA